MNFQNLFPRRKTISKAFNSHIVCYIVINNFYVNFEIIGGSCNPSQNTLRLIYKFEKCIPSFMGSLIADFIEFSDIISKFVFLQGRLGTRVCVHSISWFFKFFDNYWGNWYNQFVVIISSSVSLEVKGN